MNQQSYSVTNTERSVIISPSHLAFVFANTMARRYGQVAIRIPNRNAVWATGSVASAIAHYCCVRKPSNNN